MKWHIILYLQMCRIYKVQVAFASNAFDSDTTFALESYGVHLIHFVDLHLTVLNHIRAQAWSTLELGLSVCVHTNTDYMCMYACFRCSSF